MKIHRVEFKMKSAVKFWTSLGLVERMNAILNLLIVKLTKQNNGFGNNKSNLELKWTPAKQDTGKRTFKTNTYGLVTVLWSSFHGKEIYIKLAEYSVDTTNHAVRGAHGRAAAVTKFRIKHHEVPGRREVTIHPTSMVLEEHKSGNLSQHNHLKPGSYFRETIDMLAPDDRPKTISVTSKCGGNKGNPHKPHQSETQLRPVTRLHADHFTLGIGP